ncbi:Rieske 2Fe-2S domain-containing protein [Methylomonas sp. MO1]|uniref:Rieske (2Fe-2S) protein n=1 Tax=unclassified Methylomonas TaxID=2608980 RepID=UPI00036BF517|nr:MULTISPECIES: Rieske 2Fe-2S domain-containing protein [unclassified Methylomonas]MDT4289093.1 Rieske 2Fe-2S domain-containing protein [Methylomonas sp. MO1]
MSVKHQFTICPTQQLPELGKFSFELLYRGAPQHAVLIRFQGEVYGYLNQCVHMPRTLDCENSNIFDESGRYLQCSMHSICYDPVSGESLSEICLGKKLTALKVKEQDEWIYLVDKRAAITG